jgi:hypothetical protein
MELSGPAVRMRIARLSAKMEKEADESSCENAADAGSADTKEVTE